MAEERPIDPEDDESPAIDELPDEVPDGDVGEDDPTIKEEVPE